MCDSVFCEPFKQNHPCVTGAFDHDFGQYPDLRLDDDVGLRACINCNLGIRLDDTEPDGVCPSTMKLLPPRSGPYRKAEKRRVFERALELAKQACSNP